MDKIGVLFILNLAFPSFNNLLGSFGSGIPQLFIIIYIYCLNFRRKIKNIKYKLLFLYLIILMTISLTYNSMITQEYFTVLDLFELYRPILFCGAYYSGYKYALEEERVLIKIDKYIKIMIFLIIFTYLLYVIYPGIYNNFASYYTKDDNINRIRRFTSFFSNPYDTAYFINFIIVYYLRKIYLKFKLIEIIAIILLGMALLATQSRTGIILFGLNTLLITLYNIKFEKRMGKKIVVCIILISLFCICLGLIYNNIDYIINKYSYLYYGLNSLVKNGIRGTNSVNVRLDQYKYVMESLSSNFFIGMGVDKLNKIYTESMYSLYLYRYGFLGIMYVIILIVIQIKESYKGGKDVLPSAFLIISITNLVTFFTNNYYDQIRNNFIFYFIFGVIVGKNYFNKKYRKMELK